MAIFKGRNFGFRRN